MLFPESLDEYVTEENTVRFIEAFVEGLEMEELWVSAAAPPKRPDGRPMIRGTY